MKVLREPRNCTAFWLRAGTGVAGAFAAISFIMPLPTAAIADLVVGLVPADGLVLALLGVAAFTLTTAARPARA